MKTLLEVILTVFLLVGCSNGETSIVYNTQEDSVAIEHVLLGMWTVDFDPEIRGVVTAEPVRSPTIHINAIGLIPPPYIVVNDFYPNYVIDIDVTLTNPYVSDAYDVRLIVFTDVMGQRLENDDHWTELYDIPEGLPINPFKAYAKSEPQRIFTGQTQHTENLRVFIPPGYTQVRFAVDASVPNNCEEPYKIGSLSQEVLYNEIGSSAICRIGVYDHQNNVNSVNLYCPSITDVALLPFHYIGYSGWEVELVNNTGVATGEYTGYIIATSANSSDELYEIVTVVVSDGKTWSNAIPVSLQETVSGHLNQNDEDWFVFYCPPNGINTGYIDLTNGTAEIILYGSDPGENSPGEEIENNNYIIIDDNVDSRYYIKVVSTNVQTNYELVINVVPKISYVDCDVYVATDDGTEGGTWPVREGWSEELTIETINNMIIWCNNFWAMYGYSFIWDGTVTIMSAEYYNVGSSEAEEMHNQYGRGTDKLSLYFVQSGWSAYTIPRYPESEQNVNNVFSVYAPNIWYYESVIAHEHGHEFGYLGDMYLYEWTGCPCGDEECLEKRGVDETYMFLEDTEACYEGNLMWFTIYTSWEEYDITLLGQAQWVYGFNFRNPDSFPWQ